MVSKAHCLRHQHVACDDGFRDALVLHGGAQGEVPRQPLPKHAVGVHLQRHQNVSKKSCLSIVTDAVGLYGDLHRQLH